MTATIPTQKENPNGLHKRYLITKLAPNPHAGEYNFEGGHYEDDYIEQLPDEGAEYFIMRLDEGGSDREHIKACRIGVHAYADAIEHHLPKLANDLRQRYPLLK